MLYLYDRAIVDDLQRSFTPAGADTPIVRVIDPEGILDVAAQLKEDRLSFPLVSVYRNPNIEIDSARTNFSRMHFGVESVIDNKTNMIYHEKAIPVKISYLLTVLTTSTADMDEIIRELMFKYVQMYFLSIKLPYEDDRRVRFGVTLAQDSIERKTSTLEYLREGKLYETALTLNCEGCVLVSYTPVKLTRPEAQVEIKDPGT